MPELPEVETVARALRPLLVGRTIRRVATDWPRHIQTPDSEEFKQRIAGQRIKAVRRRGKFILFPLSDGDTLIVHLRMSGHLAVVPAEAERHKHDHTIFTLEPIEAGMLEELRFRDQRKFGRVYLVADAQEVVGQLGPEPFDEEFTVERLAQMLRRRRRQIKPLLLDQSFLAGVGNIYADEALYYAHLHPLRRTESLTDAEITALHGALRQVLALGIEREGASIELYVKPDGTKGDMQNAVAVYGRTGYPCYDCGTLIERIVVGQRGTHYCPHCQPLQKGPDSRPD